MYTCVCSFRYQNAWKYSTLKRTSVAKSIDLSGDSSDVISCGVNSLKNINALLSEVYIKGINKYKDYLVNNVICMSSIPEIRSSMPDPMTRNEYE